MKGRTVDLCTDESLSDEEKWAQVQELYRRGKRGNITAIARILELTEGPPSEAEE